MDGKLAKKLGIAVGKLTPCLQKVKEKTGLDKEEILPFLKVDWGEKSFSHMRCRTSWTPVRLLGSGSYKVVYQVCREGECDRALTVMDRKEFQYHQRAMQLRIAPRIYDSFVCNQIVKKSREVRHHTVGVVMEKMDGQISDFYPFDQHLYLLEEMLDIAGKALKGGLDHGDWKISNYLWKRVGGKPKAYLSDFGETTITSGTSQKVQLGICQMVGCIISTMIFLSAYGTTFIYQGEVVEDLLSVEKKYPELVERVILSAQYLIEEAKRRYQITMIIDEDYKSAKVQRFFERHLPWIATTPGSDIFQV